MSESLLREALMLADAALSGANMNMAVVERKVKAAIAMSAIPEGYALVPIEPTRAMSLAGKHAVQDAHDMRFERDQAIAIWSKMLEAAKEVQS